MTCTQSALVTAGQGAFPLGWSVAPTESPSVLTQEPVRLRYKLTFKQGGQPFSEVGEVKDFPDLAALGTA